MSSTEGREGSTVTKRQGKTSRSPCYKFLNFELNHAKKYFKTASIDGMDHVTEGKSIIRRIIWSLILVFSLIACLYFLFEHGRDFANQPTSTTLNIIRPSEGLAFPAITVCNLNPVSKSYAESENISSFLSFVLVGSDFFERNSPEDCNDIVANAGLSDSTLTFDEIFRSGANPRDKFILTCKFALNGTSNSDCSDALTPIVTEFGLCHTFNSITNNQPDLYFQHGGSKYGLRMVVNISQSDYIASLDDDAGIIVSIHNRHTFPDPFENGISVSPGTHARIGITSSRTIDKTGKGNCLDSGTLNNLQPNVEYSTSGCRANARYEYILNDTPCNCVEYHTPLLGEGLASERNCTIADICCIVETDTFVESSVVCPPPCDYTSYDTTVSYSKFPYNSIAQTYSLLEGVDFDTIENNLLSFNVYFSDLYIQHAETVVSYGPRLLVADIGGTMGLFLGASIISLIELIILFYDEIKGVCCSCKKVRNGWDEFELKLAHPGRKTEENKEQEEENKEQEEEKKATTKKGDKDDDQHKTSPV